MKGWWVVLNRLLRWLKPPEQLSDAADPWNLSNRLFSFSKRDYMTTGRAVEGVLVMGATGAGKSSASGRTIALSYLAAGFGGLVLCAKPDEARDMGTILPRSGKVG